MGCFTALKRVQVEGLQIDTRSCNRDGGQDGAWGGRSGTRGT